MMATSSANGAQEQGIGTGWQAVPSGWRAVAQQVASGIRAILQQRELHQQGRRWQKGRRHKQHAYSINCINAPADSCPPNAFHPFMGTQLRTCRQLPPKLLPLLVDVHLRFELRAPAAQRVPGRMFSFSREVGPSGLAPSC